MDIFDILGPVMVGPSSSHTAGAVRIGRVASRLLGEKVVDARIILHGSFAATGTGHGTDRALAAGLMGMDTDDPRIPYALLLAEQAGMSIAFSQEDLGEVHPNSALLQLTGEHGAQMEILGCSVGGGRIRIRRIQGMDVDFTGENTTLILPHTDQPGIVAEVADSLAKGQINIATMQVFRSQRGGTAIMVIETDQAVPEHVRHKIQNIKGIQSLTYLEERE